MHHYVHYTYHLCERMVRRVATESKRRRQILTFSPRLVSLLSKLFNFVTLFLTTFKDSNGAYAIHQPSTDSLKAYRWSPVVGTSRQRETKIPTHLKVAAWQTKSRHEVSTFDLANEASDKRNDISRTLLSLVFAVNSSTVRPRA